MSLLIKPLYPLSQTVNSGAQKNTEELRNQLKLRQSPKLRMAAGRELRRQSTAGGTRQPRRQDPRRRRRRIKKKPAAIFSSSTFTHDTAPATTTPSTRPLAC
ncbi:hypothetical protein BRADI_2g18449v3 [Brachypodium distachyon]|uniref:Uncharacterized protein n=1 Tax=Brachypodium distachyon TaxID=15368 RepID=A0A0Q3IXH9_BRADI|nr:hypothetical protein BRADI_2g18449v3 [Brachypodium distachyon]